MKPKDNADFLSTLSVNPLNPRSMRIIRRILAALMVAIVCYVAPLWGEIALLFDIRMLIIIGACLTVLLTQPEITLKEARIAARSDRYSVLLILLSAVTCQIMAVLEWRFFRQNASPLAIMTCSVVGNVLLIGGITFRVSAIRVLKRSFTSTVQVTEEQQLVTSGPYKRLRHPSYLGAYAAYIGAALLLNAYISAAAVAIVMFHVYRFRMGIEEAELIRSFGDHYLRYLLATKRMIPHIY